MYWRCTVSEDIRKEVMQRLASKNINDTYRLPFNLILKTGVRYMTRVNVNVVEDLVNGAGGCLCRVDTRQHPQLHVIPV
jgi:hypothetical protein